MDAQELTGQVALVSGGSRGIGAAVCRVLAAAGADVVVGYKDRRAAAEAVVASIVEAGGRATAGAVDVRSAASVDAFVQGALARHGKLDVLIACHGVARDMLVAMMSDDEWQDVVDTNAGGAFRLVRACARPMMQARRGRVVLVSSVAAHKGGKGQANYVASKAALEGMTKALAVELGARGVCVNALAPGVVETDMSAQVLQHARAEVLSKIVLGRTGTVDEIAQAALFLASPRASYITGAVLAVDGGFKLA